MHKIQQPEEVEGRKKKRNGECRGCNIAGKKKRSRTSKGCPVCKVPLHQRCWGAWHAKLALEPKFKYRKSGFTWVPIPERSFLRHRASFGPGDSESEMDDEG